MIELGAGFDWGSLTAGRYFLNGALMGRSHEEMKLIEEIIDFRVRDFIDVRLNFFIWYGFMHLQLRRRYSRYTDL